MQERMQASDYLNTETHTSIAQVDDVLVQDQKQ